MAIDEGMLQRLRQLLAPDFAKASVNVWKSGVRTLSPIVAAQSNVVTSTGAYGIYVLNFAPVTFNSAPVVSAWSSISSAGAFVHLSMYAVTRTYFQFYMEQFGPAQAVVPVGQTVTIEWIAVGS